MGTHLHDPAWVKARKIHQCVACAYDIAPGETYVVQTGYYEDHMFRNKFHIECWNTLSEEGEFEFSPGELEPPERLTLKEPTP